MLYLVYIFANLYGLTKWKNENQKSGGWMEIFLQQEMLAYSLFAEQ